MIIPDDFSDTLALVYDSALDQAAWPALLQRLATLFRSHFADSFRRSADFSEFGGIQVGLDDADYNDVFLGVWVKRNVWSKRRPVQRAGDVLTTRQIMTPEDLRRSEMYNDYLASRDLHEGLRLDLWASNGRVEDISLLRPWSAGPYSETEIDIARALLPHLRRSAEIARRLRQADYLASCGLAALEQLTAAFLVLDRAGQILHANAAARAMLEAEDGFAATSAGLAGATPAVTARLRATLADACFRTGHTAASGALRLPRPSGRPALALVALPLRPGGSEAVQGWGDAPSVLVCITDPEANTRLPQAQLVALFGLTQAEAALAGGLLAGQELRDIAEQSGRSINTVRSQLATLMAKTDTGRQAELVRLLSRLPLGADRVDGRI